MGSYGFNRNDMEVQRIIKEIAYTVLVLVLISVIAMLLLDIFMIWMDKELLKK